MLVLKLVSVFKCILSVLSVWLKVVTQLKRKLKKLEVIQHLFGVGVGSQGGGGGV